MSSTTQAPPTRSEHAEIFEDMGSFLAHLEYAVTVLPEDAPRVLRSLADHARKVRGSTFRRTTDALDEGSREAQHQVEQSAAQAAQVLRSGLAALDQRVRDAEDLTASTRTTVAIELRGGS